jgi:hypothetical protein
MASNEYSFDFSLPGNVSGGLQEQAALSDMPTFAEYYVDDELLAIPFGNTLPSRRRFVFCRSVRRATYQARW